MIITINLNKSGQFAFNNAKFLNLEVDDYDSAEDLLDDIADGAVIRGNQLFTAATGTPNVRRITSRRPVLISASAIVAAGTPRATFIEADEVAA